MHTGRSLREDTSHNQERTTEIEFDTEPLTAWVYRLSVAPMFQRLALQIERFSKRRPLTFDRGFVLVHAFLALTADLVRIAADAIADNSGSAALAIETDGLRTGTADSVTTNIAGGAALAVAIGCVLATAEAVRARSGATLAAAVYVARRAANAINADLRGAAAGCAARSLTGFAGGHGSGESSGPQAQRRHHRAADRATQHSQHFPA